MNRHIDSIAIETLRYLRHNVLSPSEMEDIQVPDVFIEKFAELIVGECIEQVRGQYIPVLEDKEMMKDTHWDGYVQCGVDSVVAIREHFGVEE